MTRRLILVITILSIAGSLQTFGQSPVTLSVWPCKAGNCLGTSTNGWLVGEIRTFAFGADSTKLIQELAQAGWVECRGQDVSAAEFPKLAAIIGPTWGSAEGKYTFYLPDLRGIFLRGWNHDKKDAGAQPYRGDIDVAKRSAPKPDKVPNQGIAGAVTANNKFDPNHVGSLQPDRVGPHNHEVAESGPFQLLPTLEIPQT